MNKMITFLLAAIAATLLVVATQGTARARPPIEVLSSMPAGITKSGHDTVTCDTNGERIEILDSNNKVMPLSQITFCNPSATVVRIYSGNGNAIADGTPFCNTSSCAGICVNLDSGPNVWNCATDSGTQSTHLLGGR